MRGSNQIIARCRRPVLWTIALLCAAASVGLLAVPAADLKGPSASDRQITLVVTSLLQREHLSKHPLDDEMSRRTLDSFLKSLDPMKLYFYQSDIDEFMQRRDDLDNMIKKGDVSFAYTVFNRFLQRVDERVAAIDEMLGSKFDFTVDDELVTDRDLLKYPRNKQESQERWRKRLKYDLLVLKGDKTEGEKAIDKLTRRYHTFAKRMHQFDDDELLEIYLTSMTTSFDPHTTYMSKASHKNFQIMLGLNLEGIGAALQSDDGQTLVTKVIPGGAADKHGKLKVEDKIVGVGQGPEGEIVDILDMKLNDVVDMIRGEAGTVVRLSVIPTGSNEVKTYAITRAKIELKDSEARGVIFEEGKKADGAPLKVGVIGLPSFYMDMEAARHGVANFKSTTRDMHVILDDFNAKNVDVVVLDLRHNGGGSLTEAINCTGLFIKNGPVVQVKDQDGRVQVYDDLDRDEVWKGPLVVMTSKFSASASEILAGAIQDYGRGIIVGDESTHGKGTVQSLLDLGERLFRIDDPPNLGALKITMQQFYRPNGDSTQKRGVLADVVLPSVSNYMDVGEADLDFAVDFDRVSAARYDRANMVSSDLVKALREHSASRRQGSTDWDKLMKNIERYREQKAKKTVTLNEEKFFALRADLDADKEDEKVFDEQANPDDEVIKRDFYVNEVLSISAEYARALEANKVARVR